ncbi:unnamed protein product [Rotaria sp. Silwood1]|nr:unnamed protein product [Rotaria sp. Silwood1]CAF1504430.1 unnamed protein product [Rotaria sp. Silwood1]CAF1548090.1 unnamed protein product [Rotaria sp. Silwood1]CAF3652834.1 unnamed protein product [Rotaria sp. Silwood1]CAF3724711.1 unnamed protein product [Rotaria sp. Silwood1]
MTISILDLPDDVLVDLFCRYVSDKDLCRLEQVCRKFHNILCNYTLPWKKALARLTNVSFSLLKNEAGCSSFQNVHHNSTILSHSFHLSANYHYEILFDRSNDFSRLLPHDYRPPLKDLNLCSKLDCDINRTINNYHYLISLAYNWNKQNKYINNTLIKFVHRAQTSILQYDEHNHQLWFTHDHTLRCLNLHTNHIDYSYEFNYDDILCYKIYNDHLICVANGNLLRIICRQTNDIYSCYNDQNLQQILPGERNDILSLDIYSNDKERYLIVNGSRDHTVSMRTFDMSTQTNQLIWCTRVDDRVLCNRFTSDGQYFLIGTGGTSSLYPLVLFNTEKAQPIHLYNAKYRLGAGVRCIEWASSNVFIAAGFDNQFKEFDIRTGQCHYTFNDEFGNDYCSLAVSVDNNHVSNGIILGGNHHSTVRLVNRKQRQLQNVYFVSKQSSPVHSLAVTSEYLFASVDRSIVALDFTGCNRQLQEIHRKF